MCFRFALGALCIGVLALSCKPREFDASETKSESGAIEKRSVKVGSTFGVKLEEPMPYEWIVATINESDLVLKEKKYEPLPFNPPVGAPAQVELRFQALKAGETTLQLELKRGQRDTTPIRVKTLKISIKERASSNGSKDE